jgi:hypothetical protein
VSQTLLFPDPRPLVERLGADFFRKAPEGPGVYLMRDAASEVLYVGKAKSLRRRLASYRVANPDRLRRRHLQLLRRVARIELQECQDEPAALAREAELLRALRPRFNRAGTWPGVRRFLAWRATEHRLELAVTVAVEPGWSFYGPMGTGAIHLRALLVRLCWCALQPDRGLAAMPEGWFRGRLEETAGVPVQPGTGPFLKDIVRHLGALFSGDPEPFVACVRDRTTTQNHPFEVATREADLEALGEFADRIAQKLAQA